MTFAAPLWLWALLVLPLLAALEVWAARTDQERIARFVARPLWGRVVLRSAARWRWIRLGLVLAGTAGLVLALARPQWGIIREKVEREGVDIVLAIDTSGSMATEDVAPNRLFLARAALSSLVSRLEGDRFGLLAFEGEAYPLVPLTLDADAVGLFLETIEPGLVPSPGSSLGIGLAKGLEMFVDTDRRNKVMVLVSDGEDLEGEVEAAVTKAKTAGVVVHTVGVGTERGEPVPDFDREGNRTGFKKDESGGAVVSRLNAATLEAIARGTGGRFFQITATDTALAGLAAAIEGMEERTLAREFSYRKKERFQVPLGIALACLAAALLLPPPPLRRRTAPALPAAAALLLVAFGTPAEAGVADELLLRPKRLTSAGRQEYEKGNHPESLKAFEDAAARRPDDPRTKFNLADGLYKNGKYDEAAALFRALGDDPKSPLAPAARYNLGNTLYQKQDFPGAIGAYREALRLTPEDGDTRRNLEMALRALQQQKSQQNKDQKQNQDPDQKQKQDQDQKQRQNKNDQRPKTEEERQQERFQKEAGMPKERAEQLLKALQQNEKAEQKRLLAEQQPKRKTGKDW